MTRPAQPTLPSEDDLHAIAESICRTFYGEWIGAWPNGLCNTISKELCKLRTTALEASKP